MLIYRKINRQTVKIVLDWGEANCISWEAMLPSGERITSGVTCDDYGDLVEAIPEIEDMVEISMDIASGDYEYPTKDR